MVYAVLRRARQLAAEPDFGVEREGGVGGEGLVRWWVGSKREGGFGARGSCGTRGRREDVGVRSCRRVV